MPHQAWRTSPCGTRATSVTRLSSGSFCPDASFALDYALVRMTHLVDGLVVDPARMRANLEASYGTVFSQTALLELIRKGPVATRPIASVQAASADAMASRRHLRDYARRPGESGAFSEDHFRGSAAASVDNLARITVEWLRAAGPSW